MDWKEEAREAAVRNVIFDSGNDLVKIDDILERAELYYEFLTKTEGAQDKLDKLRRLMNLYDPQKGLRVRVDDNRPAGDWSLGLSMHERIEKIISS